MSGSSLLRNINNIKNSASQQFESEKRDLRRSNSLLTPRNGSAGSSSSSFPSLRRPNNTLLGLDPKELLLPPKWRKQEKEKEPPLKNTDFWINDAEATLTSEGTSIAACDSSTNLQDSLSSRSILSCESSPTSSFSEASKHFEIRLQAAESLIKASKLKHLDHLNFDMNLNSKEEDASTIAKRSSSISSLRLRSSSLNREFSLDRNRRKSFAGSQNNLSLTPTSERSVLTKFQKFGSNQEFKEEKGRRISRFLRPDFFDTPREESQYFKEKEAQKALENERRKSRFIKKRENKAFCEDIPSMKDELNSIIKEESSEFQKSNLAPSTDQVEPSAPPKPDIPNNPKEDTICSKSSVIKDDTKGVDARFRSKIPTKFKKNESLLKPVESKQKLKKENQSSLLQRSKTEVKKSLENCSKFVKKYGLEKTKTKPALEKKPLKTSVSDPNDKLQKQMKTNEKENEKKKKIGLKKNLVEPVLKPKNVSSQLKSKNIKEQIQLVCKEEEPKTSEAITTENKTSETILENCWDTNLENCCETNVEECCETNSEERIPSAAEKREDLNLTLPGCSPVLRDQQEQESITDRIRRKSFYSRFNDRKRKTPLSALGSRSYLSSMTLPRNFSFSSKSRDLLSTDNYLENNRIPLEKRYSLYNNILSNANTSERSRRYTSTEFGLDQQGLVDGENLVQPNKDERNNYCLNDLPSNGGGHSET